MNFAEHLEQDRRLVLLRALENASQYRANATLLRRYCDVVGHAVSADRLDGDLAWLQEQGLLSTERHAELTVATLTQRGLDVATGRAVCPGVARPSPGG